MEDNKSIIIFLIFVLVMLGIFIGGIFIEDMAPITVISILLVSLVWGLVTAYKKNARKQLFHGVSEKTGWSYSDEDRILSGTQNKISFKIHFNHENSLKLYTTINRHLKSQITFIRRKTIIGISPKNAIVTTSDGTFDTDFITQCGDKHFSTLFCTPQILACMLSEQSRFIKKITATSNNEGLLFYCSFTRQLFSGPEELTAGILQLLELAHFVHTNPAPLPKPDEYTSKADNFHTIEEYISKLKGKNRQVIIKNCIGLFVDFYNDPELKNYKKKLTSSKIPIVRYLAGLFLFNDKTFKDLVKKHNFGYIDTFLDILREIKDPIFTQKLEIIYQTYSDDWIKEKTAALILKTGDNSALEFMFTELKRIQKLRSENTDDFNYLKNIETSIVQYLGKWGDKGRLSISSTDGPKGSLSLDDIE